ncbi:DUF4253 domain-containing protein [Nocardia sp. NPDC058058]|uniref:DUF4253 domain-containing protein n=1 Tax=Nocardia sp. NPDC058058 TaxID=3346317 RepID=UPI0036DF7A99
MHLIAIDDILSCPMSVSHTRFLAVVDSVAFPVLPVGLPSGRFIDAERSDGRAVMWVTDVRLPRAGALWASLYEQRLETGLYPLLLDALDSSPRAVLQRDYRPWCNENLRFVPIEKINALDADTVLRGLWPEIDDDDPRPIPQQWPGLAVPSRGGADPDRTAWELARRFADESDRLVGLVPTPRGADALSLCGWWGQLNHTNFTEEVSAVLRSWELRFGVRVIKVGWDTLDLSVGAPPTSREHALQVAAEHLAFCPDNLACDPIESYAADLIGRTHWTFWWD